jgi:hypothetical protein
LISARTASPETASRKESRRETAAGADAVSGLELERSIFDSSETEILSVAFAKAWAYVEFDPMLGVLQVQERQSELARCVMTILKLGDSNPTSIANSAIALMRKNQSRFLRRYVAGNLTSDRRLSAAP